MKIEIRLNGETHELPASLSIAQLLEHFDLPKDRVRHRRSHKGDIEHPGKPEVRDVFGLAPQEAPVFLARKTGSDAFVGHTVRLCSGRLGERREDRGVGVVAPARAQAEMRAKHAVCAQLVALVVA